MSKKGKPAPILTLRTAIAVVVSIIVAGSCASEKTDEAVEPSAKQVEQQQGTRPEPATPPAEPASPPAGTTQADQDYDPTVLTIMAIDVDTRLAVLCGLAETDVFFKYDSAKVLPAAEERLQKLATCATSGPAKGKELMIVGRTGPVGPDEYNEKLGMSRAQSVANKLRELGVDKTRVETESKGEAAAPEERPGVWPLHRRVTVRLQE